MRIVTCADSTHKVIIRAGMHRIKTLKVAIVGGGVVGGGVVELLRRQARVLLGHGVAFDLKTLVVRDLSKARDFSIPSSTHVTSDAAAAYADPGVDLVVEVVGGSDGVAAEVVFGAAKRGKHVVTANKALLAALLPEIETAFPQDAPQRLGFEAAVAGGIPIIRAVGQSLAPDDVFAVGGILNGTSNYILSQMHEGSGASFAAALSGAQAAGFAETDATADVEGHDARNKLVILSRLAFGATLPVAAVPTRGIVRVTPEDISGARALGCAIKLLARARLVQHATGGSAVEASVSPSLVPADGAIGRTGGAGNIVEVDGALCGITSYSGPGAGRFPTAVSVVADMLSIARGEASSTPFPRAAASGLGLSGEPTGLWYVRLSHGGQARADALASVFSARGISLRIVSAGESGAGGKPVIALVTADAAAADVRAAAAAVAGNDADSAIVMPYVA